ncbi:unnamed protein product [Prorocentrum cordatum]|uniref:Ribosome biogenesis protein NOP53 n=1 Tax=Prorocentrum cordatum TaxID=2364126 RepID=A0ABN9VMJ9_9DINO|nr:unnamed protein product [Polarella glacialis]
MPPLGVFDQALTVSLRVSPWSSCPRSCWPPEICVKPLQRKPVCSLVRPGRSASPAALQAMPCPRALLTTKNTFLACRSPWMEDIVLPRRSISDPTSSSTASVAETEWTQRDTSSCDKSSSVATRSATGHCSSSTLAGAAESSRAAGQAEDEPLQPRTRAQRRRQQRKLARELGRPLIRRGRDQDRPADGDDDQSQLSSDPPARLIRKRPDQDRPADGGDAQSQLSFEGPPDPLARPEAERQIRKRRDQGQLSAAVSSSRGPARVEGSPTKISL